MDAGRHAGDHGHQWRAVTVEVPGQPTARRKVGRSASPSTGPAGLGAELQLFGRDRVFEDALAQAAALVPE